MKQFIKAGIAIAAFALSSVANAGLINVTYKDQGGSNTINTQTYYDVPFNLTELTTPYRPSIDTITWAEILFSFKDTGPDSEEKYTIAIGNDVIGSSGVLIDIPNKGADYGPFSITNTSLANLSDTGLLSLRISTTSGSFQFVSATLKAEVELGKVPPANVPEPLSVALLGIGVAGIAASRRRKV